MRDWIHQQLHMNLEETFSLLAVVVVPFGLLVKLVYAVLMRLFRRTILADVQARRYAKWFVARYETFENPYLGETTGLDLQSTFVPLFFRSAVTGAETRVPAIEAIARRPDMPAGPRRNVLVQGEPGSGKTTLLKAYGVALLKDRRAWETDQSVEQGDVPILVPFRKLAAVLPKGGGLAEYIMRSILVDDVGMTPEKAQDFFSAQLDKDRCVVLLDGLDELTAAQYPHVRDAVHSFMASRDPTLPTWKARLVITCRRQNLLQIRDEWEGPVAATVYLLAPLRNADVYRFLDRLRAKFRNPTGPEDLLAAIRRSGTMELHRTPLVLAMSVGLFVRKVYFEIPHSIGELYRLMIEEMLDRHRFPRDPVGAPNRFRLKDKYRFLREFAFVAAYGPIGFDEFAVHDLTALAEGLAAALHRVHPDEVADFVDEIVERSGLLEPVTDESLVFAHRSIQEHLVSAELLSRDVEGHVLLRAKAPDPVWSQVITFYAAAADQRRASPLVDEIAGTDLVLAGHCLASADVTDDVAMPIIEALAARTERDPDDATASLAALLAAVSSPRDSVQTSAVRAVTKVLTGLVARDKVVSLFGGNVESLIRVLTTIASSHAPTIAALVPILAEAAPDDPRLIEPLWRCLATPGIHTTASADKIADRLLGMATVTECFVELQRQDPIAIAEITLGARRHAYPFVRGWPLESNLVTLLAFGELVDAAISPHNRFLEARAAGGAVFAGVERARARTVRITPYRAMRSAAEVTLVVAVLGVAGFFGFDLDRMVRESGQSVFPLVCLPPAFAFILLLRLPGASASQHLLGAHPLARWVRATRADPDEATWLSAALAAVVVVVPLGLFAVALAPLIAVGPAFYFVVATLAIMVFHVVMLFDWFTPGKSYFLVRPNRFVDLYDDPLSASWVNPARLPRTTARDVLSPSGTGPSGP